MDAVSQFLASGIMVGGLYALLALSIVLICKATGVFNFAIGQFVMVAGFIFWAFIVQLGLPIWLSFILSIITAAFMGLLVDRFTMRPLIGQAVASQMMVTLALIYLINGITLIIWGGAVRSVPDFLPGETWRLGSATFSNELTWAFGAAVVIFGIFAVFYNRADRIKASVCIFFASVRPIPSG